MKFVKRILKTLLFSVIILLIALNLFTMVSIKLFHMDYPILFGYTYFEVQTGSMRPTIMEGDLIIVKITKDIHIGDIITYNENNVFITHRVIDISELITTQGDNNSAADAPITSDAVLGKVVQIVPNVGVFRYVLTHPYFLVVLVAALVIYSVISEKNER